MCCDDNKVGRGPPECCDGYLCRLCATRAAMMAEDCHCAVIAIGVVLGPQ